MTKAEIFEMIGNTEKRQCEALKAVNDLINPVSFSNNDTAILAAILLTLNSSICSTMNNLAMILYEMLPDEGGMTP